MSGDGEGVGVVYQDDRAALCVLVEARTGRLWSPAARAFELAPSDPWTVMRPLVAPGVNFGGTRIAWFEGAPPPWFDGELYVSVHASKTGPPIGRVAVPGATVVAFGAEAWIT